MCGSGTRMTSLSGLTSDDGLLYGGLSKLWSFFGSLV